jgi:putative addiction module component (TIGR02574 family)
MIDLNQPIEISKLSLDERISLVEALWNHIADEAGVIVLTDAQKAELDRRWVAYRADPERGYSWEEVRARIESQ